jgi:hypothetical protein
VGGRVSGAGLPVVSTKAPPLKMSVRERVRWRVAKLLNRHQRLCWAELGSWAVYGAEMRQRTWLNDRCLDECGSCWCNKRNPSKGRP